MKKIFFNFLILTSILAAQTYEYQFSIGELDETSSFYITANGNIYVTDLDRDEIILLDTLGSLIKSFGGYGWDENSFDDPADIFADPLSVYVADKNNHSIKRFDKNLNFISSFNKRESNSSEEQFGYPLSCATSNQGDLYFIDSENNRIMKFDVFGNFITSFGGIDAGKYQLKNPKQLAISSSNNIYVIDGTEIVAFDHFGNGISRVETKLNLISLRILFDNLVVCTDTEIYFAQLKTAESKLTKIDIPDFEIKNIKSAILFNSKFYVLINNSILLFSKIN